MNRNDAKTVSIVAQGCFHPVTKVQSASLHFFLGSEEDDPDSEEEVCRQFFSWRDGYLSYFFISKKWIFDRFTTNGKSTKKRGAETTS